MPGHNSIPKSISRMDGLVDRALARCKRSRLFADVSSHRVEPVRVTIVDNETSPPRKFAGWITFAARGDCIGYCQDPWVSRCSWFSNREGRTRRGDFDSATFATSLKELLDSLAVLNDLHATLNTSQHEGITKKRKRTKTAK